MARVGVTYAGFLVRQFEGGGITVLTAYARDIGHEHDVRILITDRSRVVVSDTGKELEGKQLTVIADNSATTLGGRFTRLQVAGSAADDLLLLGPSREVFGMERPPFGMRPDDPQVTIENVATAGGDGRRDAVTNGGRPGGARRPLVMREQPLRILVLAVPASDLTHAWLALVPGLGLAASLALPAAVLLAVLLARSITRPLRDLTRATGLVAEGRFDVAVPAARGDVVGELASSFSTLSRRVGESQAEQRRLIADVSHNPKTPLTSIPASAAAKGHAATPEEAADGQRHPRRGAGGWPRGSETCCSFLS
jgi:methyl-accepting chemotaxis protein